MEEEGPSEEDEEGVPIFRLNFTLHRVWPDLHPTSFIRDNANFLFCLSLMKIVLFVSLKNPSTYYSS